MIPRWFRSLFRRPRHIAYTPTPGHLRLESCDIAARCPVAQRVYAWPGVTVYVPLPLCGLN